uniref:Growth hormone-inducible transmembrane protein n=1 Tax=Parastrongyloides trichosuri TaxID=131310 RepID=A0A0N4ZCY1_PARTI
MLSRLLITSTCRIGQISSRSFTNTISNNARNSWRNVNSTFRTGAFTRTGPTLKERLLGPTTGKPFIYGTYSLIGASVFGLGMLGYYGLSQKDSITRSSVYWPQYVRDRIKSTYGYLFGSLAVTGAASFAAFRVPAILNFAMRGGFLPFLVFMGATIGTSMLCQSVDYQSNPGLKHITWLLHTSTLGALLCPLILAGGPVLLKAALYTAGIVAGLTTVAYTAPSEKFLYMGGPLAMGLGFVLMANIGSIFLPPNTAVGAGLYSVVLYGGLILFSAFLLYNTQKVVHRAVNMPTGGYMPYQGYNNDSRSMTSYGDRYDPINAQMGIYMDIVNIFIRLVMIFGGSSNRK